jgi:succinoglycan biosynthesis transport protein ExoP
VANALRAHTNPNPPTPAATHLSSAPGYSEVQSILGILLRKWPYLLVGACAGLAIGFMLVAVFLPTLYKSSARIMIDRSVNRFLETSKIAVGPKFDDMETGSQLHVLSSESIIVPVVRTLGLAKDPEFIGVLNPGGDGTDTTLKRVLRGVLTFVGWGSSNEIDPATVLERTAIESFAKRLTVSREDVPNVINVTFASKSPQKAATIANALADAYLAAAQKERTEFTRTAHRLLEDRLAQLRHQLNEADRALREFRMATSITSTEPDDPNSIFFTTQLANLNARLVAARFALLENKARIDNAQRTVADEAAAPHVPDNAVIARLRSQYLELSIWATEIESRVGPAHGAVVKIRQRMERVERAIEDEKARLARANPNEETFSKARYDTLSTVLSELIAEADKQTQGRLTLRDLENSADSLRALYNIYVQRLNTLNMSKPNSTPVLEPRIISRAAPALRSESKRALLVLAASLMVGLLLGGGAALATELGGNTFRTPGQVRSAMRVYCGVAPAVRRRTERSADRAAARRTDLEEYVLDAPFSRFAETLRNVKVLVTNAHRSNGDKVFCVASAVADEGKTTILANLAAVISTSSTARVLVIDCDLHRRHLSTRMAPDARMGLLEALEDPSRLSAFVHTMERSGADILPCATSARAPHAAELLGSPQMERLLDAARQSYDFILLEVAPIMALVDAKLIERFVDRFVLVIEWSKTSRTAVHEALAEVRSLHNRTLCAVLNKADPLVAETYMGGQADYGSA